MKRREDFTQVLKDRRTINRDEEIEHRIRKKEGKKRRTREGGVIS